MNKTQKINAYKKRLRIELELNLHNPDYSVARLMLDNEPYETFSNCGGKTAYNRACEAKQEAIRLYKEELGGK